jgi:heme/copper-type cytochrome/quinol oxidase subunit 2
MKGTLVVDTQQDYEAWLKERAELAGGAQSASSPSPSPGVPQPQTKPPEPAASPSPGG